MSSIESGEIREAKSLRSAHLEPQTKAEHSPAIQADLAAIQGPGASHDKNSSISRFAHFGAEKTLAKPEFIAIAADVGLYQGMNLSERFFGKGEQILQANAGKLNITAHKNELTAAKFLALPVAAAATYSFVNDFHSLSKSATIYDHLKDSAALVADSVAVAGAISTYVPKAKFFSIPAKYAGLTARALLGPLNDGSKNQEKSD